MGGIDSAYFAEYARLCTLAFACARKHVDTLATLFEIMAFESNYPAFKYNANAIADLRSRMAMHIPDAELRGEITRLINRSYNYVGTGLYDKFQLATNGIAV